MQNFRTARCLQRLDELLNGVHLRLACNNNNNLMSLFKNQLQLFDEGKHSMESDVYAYGVVLWEIVTCDEPYKGLTDRQIMRKLDKNEV